MLTEELKKEIEEAQKKYPDRKSAVMEVLMAAQRIRGHVTEEDMRDIATALGINPIAVSEVGAFYTMYNVERPVGRYHIQVCRNISCSLLGAERLLEYIEGRLGIKVGETSEDKKFTLTTVECLGSCGTAPAMQINEDYHENLTEERIDGILKGLE
jgi:NADH-quinone oxidoreductase E subunit